MPENGWRKCDWFPQFPAAIERIKDLEGRMKNAHTEIRERAQASKANMQTIADVRTETAKAVGKVGTETAAAIGTIRAETATSMGAMETSAARTSARMIKRVLWVMGGIYTLSKVVDRFWP